MTTDDAAQISDQIELAFALAGEGAHAAATGAFAVARELAVTRCPPATLTKRVTNHAKPLARERESYREMIAERRHADRRLVVLADSLGLPRPDAKSGPTLGAESTYPMMMLNRLPDHEVQSYCQRYFTTGSIFELLQADPTLGAGCDVVIHVGLNDCATRMFLEPQRLALDLLPEEVKERIVLFAQRYRRMILAHLPPLHYVDPPVFRANLDAIMRLLRIRNARRVALTTIILPPARFWPGTPGVNQNFADYNLGIMRAAEHGGGVLFDLDRLVWAREHEAVLLDDGMHLSTAGHALFADELAALLT